MQRILSYIRKAVDDYNMIEDGDKIAVCLSGGKDSIALLMGLKNLQRFYDKKFEVIAISINPGFEFFNSDFLKKTCDNIGVQYVEEESHINDSFNNNLLDYPTYTKPRVYEGMEVPEVLLSGDHKKIEQYRYEESLRKTKERRPDLLEK